MKLNKLAIAMSRKGAIRYGAGVLLALLLIFVVAFSGLGSSAEIVSVDDKIDANDFVDVGIAENQDVEKVHLDFVEKTLTRKCLMIENWNDNFGNEDVSFYLRDSNFPLTGKAELYSIETKSRQVDVPIYGDVAYDCSYVDNKTLEDVSDTCYRKEIVDYDSRIEYYDEDVFISDFDLSSDLAAGSIDLSINKKLKICFKTPIVETDNGWGNAGTIFVEIGDDLFVDKQHSSWWNETYANRNCFNIQASVTDSNQQLELDFDYNVNLSQVVVLRNDTDASLAWTTINNSNFNHKLWANTSVTDGSNFGICVYYNGSESTQQYNISDVMLSASGFESAGEVSGWGTQEYTSCGSYSFSTTQKYEGIGSMYISGGSCGDATNLHKAYPSQSNATMIIMYYDGMGVTAGGYDRIYDDVGRNTNSLMIDINSTRYNIGCVGGSVIGAKNRASGWHEFKIFNNGTSHGYIDGVFVTGSCTNKTTSGELEHIRYIPNGSGQSEYFDAIYIYRDYGSDNPTVTTGGEEVLSNTAPTIDTYSASSLNRSLTYTDDSTVEFEENETVRFNITVSDADEDYLTYSWYVDDELQSGMTDYYFDLAFDFTEADVYDVLVIVNDSEFSVNTSWTVDIINKVNKFWSTDFVAPTPADDSNLAGLSVNVSVLISPSIIEASDPVSFADDTEAEFDLGSYSDTDFNNSLSAVILNTYTLNDVQVFFDGFEDGTMDAWTLTGGDSWTAKSTNPYKGIYHAEASSLVGSSALMSSNISTVGYTNINVSYFRKLVGTFSAADKFMFEWFNGTNWTTLEENTTGGDSTTYVAKSFILPAIAEANPEFKLRFTCENLVASEFCRVDDVKVTGTRTPFVASGNFVSKVFDASEDITWDSITWTDNVPSNTDLKLQVRSCDDISCSGETFIGPNGVSNTYYETAQSLNVDSNRYFQYKVFFSTADDTLTSELSSVTVSGFTEAVYDTVDIDSAWIDFNGENVSMSGSGYSWSYVNTSLVVGEYTYRVYANDTFGNVNMTEERSFTVPSYNITFNVVSGEDGEPQNNTGITCDYSGFSQGGDTINPYGPYEFPAGTWECTFERTNFFTEVKTFVADSDKIVNVSISRAGFLSNEEHTQLDWLYNCWRYGECDAYDFVSGTYENVSKLWQQQIPTDVSIVGTENITNSDLSAGTNITIDYTINVPYKAGVEVQALLPIRIFYWFTDSNGNCFNQDKQADSNRAETPYCIPLMAEYLGPNNGTTSFEVKLHPDLPDGSYEIVRSIDIDPPVNGEVVWINYGREKIGTIDVVNNFLSGENPKETVEATEVVEAKAIDIPNLNKLTGKITNDLLGANSLMGLAIICAMVTIISVAYLRRNK